jgi:hypothetical protein
MQVNVGMLNMTKSWLCNTRHMRGVHASTLIISDSAAYPQLVAFQRDIFAVGKHGDHGADQVRLYSS